jgi:hypothetical protein
VDNLPPHARMVSLSGPGPTGFIRDSSACSAAEPLPAVKR